MTLTTDDYDFSELTAERLRKLEQVRSQGIDPYPAQVERSHSAAEAAAAYTDWEGKLAAEGRSPADAADGAPHVAVGGRLMSLRPHGKMSFATIQDGSGTLQLAFRKDHIGEEAYRWLQEVFDRGDFIGARGRLFRTRMGEITVQVDDYRMLAKSLNPLPEKWHGLKDTEARYRQRYLDLLTNADARQVFLTRSGIVRSLRRFLDGRGFIEVETPILQPLYGGASARPFKTFYNALGQDMYLRIADELYLKRLIIGGLDRVYEIGKDFRNEGLDTTHNPEFTQMECYWAYADYADMMRLTEGMVAQIAQDLTGSTSISFQGDTIDLAPPWRRLSLRDGILAEAGIDIYVHTDVNSLRAAIRERGLQVSPKPTWGQLVDELLGEYLQPTLIQPTFVIDYPTEISPLAKKKADDPRLAERFEVFIGARETGNAFSELNDPLDQRERFMAQAALRAAGDEETQPLDEDFILAMMHGMPPTGGLGLGIDRLTMLLTDRTSIREVILFPQLRTLKS